jgi:hypothetical protein
MYGAKLAHKQKKCVKGPFFIQKCWVCVIFFACVCVGASDSTAASDDPSSRVLCVVCIDRFLGGARYGPLWLRAVFGSGQRPKIFFGPYLLFLAVF